MKLSAPGATFIKTQEAVGGKPNLTPYPDIGGGTDIGYAHNYPPSTPPSQIPARISVEQAEALFALDTATAQQYLNANLTTSVPQQTYDGLVDYVYDRGVAAVASSGVIPLINNGSFTQAAQIVRTTGLLCNNPVLIQRRQKEASLVLQQASVISGAYQFAAA